MPDFSIDHMTESRHFGYLIRDGEQFDYDHATSECDFENGCPFGTPEPQVSV